jgi:hypothetical protein
MLIFKLGKITWKEHLADLNALVDAHGRGLEKEK